jgi:hypothetical protein
LCGAGGKLASDLGDGGEADGGITPESKWGAPLLAVGSDGVTTDPKECARLAEHMGQNTAQSLARLASNWVSLGIYKEAANECWIFHSAIVS